MMKDQPPDQLTTQQKQVIAVILTRATSLGLTVKPLLKVTIGRRVECFRLIPLGSTRAGHLESISDDLALALQVPSVLVRPIPEEGCVGISVPRNEDEVEMVFWKDNLSSPEASLASRKMTIPLSLGVDWLGKPIFDDLSTLPHLLVAGSTGSGKSVFMRSIVATFVFNKSAQLILSDTKGVEFTEFEGNPSIWSGVSSEIATTPLRTIEQMDLLCKETDRRLELFGRAGHRNIYEWNSHTSQNNKLPYLVLVIDELADIVFLPGEKGRAAKIGADKLDYLTRKARAAGIHVIAGTQRPSVDTVKGVIKANFVARIAFKTASAIDSKVILDEVGAEHLLDKGDMLYKSPSFAGLRRIHSGYASKGDIKGVLEYTSFAQSQFSHSQSQFDQTINRLDAGEDLTKQ